MKNSFLPLSRLVAITSLFLLTVLLQATSCSNDDDSNSSTTDYSGSWKVSYYFDNTDETSHFTGYIFSFNNTGVLTASNGTTTANGTWSQTSSKLIIDFGTTPNFSDLNDDWLILEKTANSIKLKDDNPAQDDQLNFLKL